MLGIALLVVLVASASAIPVSYTINYVNSELVITEGGGGIADAVLDIQSSNSTGWSTLKMKSRQIFALPVTQYAHAAGVLEGTFLALSLVLALFFFSAHIGDIALSSLVSMRMDTGIWLCCQRAPGEACCTVLETSAPPSRALPLRSALGNQLQECFVQHSSNVVPSRRLRKRSCCSGLDSTTACFYFSHSSLPMPSCPC